MNASAEYAQKRLFGLASGEGFRAFQASLIPTLPQEAIIGVRSPALRRLAKELAALERDSPCGESPFSAAEFMECLPHKFLEENSLHLLLLGSIKGYGECLARTERFLPFIDNWATCDLGLPAPLAKDTERLWPEIARWLKSDGPYVLRFAIGALLSAYMGESFRPECLSLVANLASSHYYVNMMRAWYFAEALARRWDAALPYIEARRLDAWTHNKAIQKATESARIPQERKERLKALKVRQKPPPGK